MFVLLRVAAIFVACNHKQQCLIMPVQEREESSFVRILMLCHRASTNTEVVRDGISKTAVLGLNADPRTTSSCDEACIHEDISGIKNCANCMFYNYKASTSRKAHKRCPVCGDPLKERYRIAEQRSRFMYMQGWGLQALVIKSMSYQAQLSVDKC